MIVDTHCHAWAVWPYEPPVPDPESRGRVEQLLWEMDQNGVEQAAIVSAGIDHNPDNNEYVAAAVAASLGRLQQIADVDSSWTATHHVAGAASRLRAIADRWPLAGITHYVQETNDGWFRSAAGIAFFEAAAERDLLVSLSAAPVWQKDIRALARRFPTLPILCHHLAGVQAALGPDRDGLAEVLRSADTANVLIKVSGFYYGSASTWGFPYPDSLALLEQLHREFGSRRLCWGSDYPVVRRAMTYRQALEMVRSQAPFLGEDDVDWILGRTAETVLRTRRPLPA